MGSDDDLSSKHSDLGLDYGNDELLKGRKREKVSPKTKLFLKRGSQPDKPKRVSPRKFEVDVSLQSIFL